MIAVILLLGPAASMAGDYVKPFLAFAAAIHCLMGRFGVSSLVVYCVTVIVCMTHRNKEAVEVSV